MPQNTEAQKGIESLKPLAGDQGRLEKIDIEAYRKQKQEKVEALKPLFKDGLPDILESQFRALDTHIAIFQDTDGYMDRLGDLVSKLEKNLSTLEKPLDAKNPQLLNSVKELKTQNVSPEIIASKLTMDHVDALSQSQEGKAFLQNFFIVNGTVDFYGNDDLEQKVGIGEIMSQGQDYLLVNGRPSRRVEGIRPYYEDQNGKYVKIFDGYKVEIPTVEQVAQNKDTWKFPSEGKNVREEQMAKMASNPELASRVQNGQISKEDFFSVLKTSKAYEEPAKLSSEEIDKRREMKFQEYISAALGKDVEIGKPASEEQKREILEKQGIITLQDQNFVLDAFKAIAEQESGGKYDILGQMISSGTFEGERAIGKYQIMPKNWINWTTVLFGEVVAPTAENQDLVTMSQMGKNFLKWKNRGEGYPNILKLMSVQWYGNNGKPLGGIADINQNRVKTVSGKEFPSPWEYAESISRRVVRKVA